MRPMGLLALVLAGMISAVPADDRRSYRFTLRADGLGQVQFRGRITVDGVTREIETRSTPFGFRCEAGSVIAGWFETIDPRAELNLRVYDPSYSERRPAASGSGVRRVRFAWAQPGVGPRCIDFGSGACPDPEMASPGPKFDG